MEQSEMTFGSYGECLEGPRVKWMVTHSQCVNTECYFFSDFFGNTGPHKDYAGTKQLRRPTFEESGSVSKKFLVLIT